MLGVMSGLGLSLDSKYLTPELLEQATASILKTRDGLLRAAIPTPPIGRCSFLNDLTVAELADALTLHKKICLTTREAARASTCSPWPTRVTSRERRCGA